MPHRPASPCSYPGCPEFKPCPQHAPPAWDHGGRTAAQRGYDAAWQRARSKHLRAHPGCARCGRPATEVDHIIPLQEQGARLDQRNLQSLCHHHHQEKTQLEQARRRGRRPHPGSSNTVP